MSDQKKTSGESFAGNVMKYSVATYLGFAITGLALIVKGLLPAEVLGAPVTFMTYTATLMNIGILGLDQALLRFYHEPSPPGLSRASCSRPAPAFRRRSWCCWVSRAACSLPSRWRRPSAWGRQAPASCRCCSSMRRCICWCGI